MIAFLANLFLVDVHSMAETSACFAAGVASTIKVTSGMNSGRRRSLQERTLNISSIKSFTECCARCSRVFQVGLACTALVEFTLYLAVTFGCIWSIRFRI